MKRVFEFVVGFCGDCILFGAFSLCVGAALAVHQALAVIVGYALFVPMLVVGSWTFSYGIEGKAEADKMTAAAAKRWREYYGVTAPFAVLLLVGPYLPLENKAGSLGAFAVTMAFLLLFMAYGLWAFAFMIGGREEANEMFRFMICAFRWFLYAALWLVRRICTGKRYGKDDWLTQRLDRSMQEAYDGRKKRLKR